MDDIFVAVFDQVVIFSADGFIGVADFQSKRVIDRISNFLVGQGIAGKISDADYINRGFYFFAIG